MNFKIRVLCVWTVFQLCCLFSLAGGFDDRFLEEGGIDPLRYIIAKYLDHSSLVNLHITSKSIHSAIDPEVQYRKARRLFVRAIEPELKTRFAQRQILQMTPEGHPKNISQGLFYLARQLPDVKIAWNLPPWGISLNFIQHVFGSKISQIQIFQGKNIEFHGDHGEDGSKQDTTSRTLYMRLLFKDHSFVEVLSNGVPLEIISQLYEHSTLVEATTEVGDIGYIHTWFYHLQLPRTPTSAPTTHSQRVFHAILNDPEVLFSLLGQSVLFVEAHPSEIQTVFRISSLISPML